MELMLTLKLMLLLAAIIGAAAAVVTAAPAIVLDEATAVTLRSSCGEWRAARKSLPYIIFTSKKRLPRSSISSSSLFPIGPSLRDFVRCLRHVWGEDLEPCQGGRIPIFLWCRVGADTLQHAWRLKVFEIKILGWFITPQKPYQLYKFTSQTLK